MPGLGFAAPEGSVLLAGSVARHILLDGAAQALCYLPNKGKLLSPHSLIHAGYVCLPQIPVNLLWHYLVCPLPHRSLWAVAISCLSPFAEALSHMVVDSTKTKWRDAHQDLLQGPRKMRAALLMHGLDQAAHLTVILGLWACVILSCVGIPG